LIIRLIIQTIRRDRSGSDQIDGQSNLSRPDPSGADQTDAEHQSTDLAVGVRIPRGAPANASAAPSASGGDLEDRGQRGSGQFTARPASSGGLRRRCHGRMGAGPSGSRCRGCRGRADAPGTLAAAGSRRVRGCVPSRRGLHLRPSWRSAATRRAYRRSPILASFGSVEPTAGSSMWDLHQAL
jgi:hypothetical protein